MDPDAVDRIGETLAGGAVCATHLDDAFLKAWATANATQTRCDYCEREAADPFAADINELGVLILAGLHRAWGDFNDELVPWGLGYNGTKVTAELIVDEGVTGDDRLIADLVAALPDYAWVQRDFFRLTPLERLRLGWDEFTQLVKHESRYFFGLRKADPDDPDDVSPMQILAELGGALEHASLLREWPVDEIVYRARPHRASAAYTDAWDLAAVPLSKADRAAANRMSAAGVPMFYGSRDAECAAAETVSASFGTPEAITVGRFKLLRPMCIVDLSAGVDVPSLFDPKLGDHRPQLAFLRRFQEDVAKSVTRDGKEHIDYVPTQVVCEYFRSQYRLPGGGRVGGIAYPSLQLTGHVNVVLFVANDEVVNADGTRPPRPDSERWLGPVNLSPEPLLMLTGVTRVDPSGLPGARPA